MRKEDTRLTKEQEARLKALAEMPDDLIDTADIPEALDWSNAKRGVFYQSMKQQGEIHSDKIESTV